MRCGRLLDPLQNFCELHREIDTLADLFRVLRVGPAVAQTVELGEQQFEIAGDQPMPELGIRARARQIVVGHQRNLAHLRTRLARQTENLTECPLPAG